MAVPRPLGVKQTVDILAFQTVTDVEEVGEVVHNTPQQRKIKHRQVKQTADDDDVPIAVSCSVVQTSTESDSDCEQELEKAK